MKIHRLRIVKTEAMLRIMPITQLSEIDGKHPAAALNLRWRRICNASRKLTVVANRSVIDAQLLLELQEFIYTSCECFDTYLSIIKHAGDDCKEGAIKIHKSSRENACYITNQIKHHHFEIRPIVLENSEKNIIVNGFALTRSSGMDSIVVDSRIHPNGCAMSVRKLLGSILYSLFECDQGTFKALKCKQSSELGNNRNDELSQMMNDVSDMNGPLFPSESKVWIKKITKIESGWEIINHMDKRVIGGKVRATYVGDGISRTFTIPSI
jgi:hypothetical protein